MFDYAKISKTLELNNGDVECLHEINGSRVRAWEWPWVLELARNWPTRGRALEAGCGTSRLPGLVAKLGYETYGVDDFSYEDVDEDYAARAREQFRKNAAEQTGYSLIEAGLDNLPFPDGHFDILTCVSVMEHVYRPTAPTAHHRYLREMLRVVRPGGALFFTYDVHVTPGVNDRVIGFDYAVDIRLLLENGCRPLQDGPVPSRLDMALDDDTLYYTPYIFMKYHYKSRPAYSRQTAFGFALIKEGA